MKTQAKKVTENNKRTDLQEVSDSKRSSASAKSGISSLIFNTARKHNLVFERVTKLKHIHIQKVTEAKLHRRYFNDSFWSDWSLLH